MVASGGSGTATFGDGVSVSGGSVLVESVDALVGVGRTVEVSGSEGVRVASEGAAVELEWHGRDGVRGLCVALVVVVRGVHE